jgi:hypothetical protein
MWYRNKGPLLGGILIGLISYLNRHELSDFNPLALSLLALGIYIAYDWLKMLLANYSIFPNPHWLFVVDDHIFPKSQNTFVRKFLYRSGFPFRSLMTLEGGAKEGTWIHLLAHNLKLDTELAEVRRTVRQNLKKGVRYNFILPPDPEGQAARERISDIHRDFINNLTFTTIPQDEMNKVAAENIMIIVDESGKPRGFIQIPEDTGLWWAEMSERATGLYYSNLKVAMGKKIEDTQTARP